MCSGAILEIRLRVGVIPLVVTPKAFLLTNFLSLYPQRVQKPLQITLSAVFCTKHRLNICIKLVWTHKITTFLSKNHFWSVQRVVSRPPRPIARMATGYVNLLIHLDLSSIQGTIFVPTC